MEQQSAELWEEKKQNLLRQGELAATKLLVPIVMIFVGILIIIMAAAFAGALFL
jgi:tight adherence protein C